jgi:hypothetical protein
MYTISEYQLNKFAEELGAAIGRRAEFLTGLSQQAYQLIQLVELEKSGIRDGAGFWCACDPVAHTVNDIAEYWREFKALGVE